MFAALKQKETYTRYIRSLKFSLYCLTHPMDGYWDLTHEKRGTYAAANTILALTLISRVAKLRYTSFVIETVYWEEINIFLYLSSILFPLLIFVLGNWGLTTLFDGKGRLGQIYIGACYGMAPYPLMQIPLMIISNFVTADEREFYTALSAVSLVWCAWLIITGMGQIHEYSGGKNILFLVLTLFAMLVIVFILMIFFSMISQGIAYFISIGKELMFRM